MSIKKPFTAPAAPKHPARESSDQPHVVSLHLINQSITPRFLDPELLYFHFTRERRSPQTSRQEAFSHARSVKCSW